MNKPVFYIILFLCVWGAKAQENLVPNGSFEELSTCPVGADIEKAIGWFSPTNSTPDLFNICASLSSNLSIPTNGFGFQIAEDGFGYAGIVTYSNQVNGSEYREYLAVKLNSYLKENVIYHVSFYINQANTSPLATDNLTFGFVSEITSLNTSGIISADYYYPNNFLINDTLNWIKVESYYLGTGMENYIVIGNFLSDSQTNTISTGMPETDVYYFVDNVALIEVPIGIENVFTPNNDGINDLCFYNPIFPNLDIEILNRWGEIIIETNFSNGWNGKTKYGKDALEGVYYYRIRDTLVNAKTIKTGFIQLMR